MPFIRKAAATPSVTSPAKVVVAPAAQIVVAPAPAAAAPSSTAPGNLALLNWADSGVAGDGITANGSIGLSGTAAAGSVVTVSWVSSTGARGTFAPVTASSAGSFSAGTGWMPEGNYTFTATSTKAGIASGPSASFALTIDRTAPSAPTMNAAANGSTVVLGGNAEKNATVYVYMDNSANAAVTVKANDAGVWSANVASLGDGTHTFLALARDVAGNWSPVSRQSSALVSAASGNQVNAALPVPAISAIPGGLTNDTTPTLSGTAAANATVAVYLDGSTTMLGSVKAGANGAWSFTPVGEIADGLHSFTAKVVDAGGRTSSASGALALTIDHIAPNAPSVAAFTAPTSQAAPQVKGLAEANANVAVFIDGSATAAGTVKADGSGTWSFTPSAVLGEGVHSFAARATDAAGNTGALSGNAFATIDRTAPQAPVIATFGQSLTNDSTPLVSGKAEAGSTVAVTLDNGATPIAKVTADGAGNWAFDWVGIGNGPHTFKAVATDAAGNTSGWSNSQSLTIDSQAPTTLVKSLVVAGDNVINPTEASAGTIKITGTLSQTLTSGDSLLLSVNGSSIAVGAGNISGTTFSVDVSKPGQGWTNGSVAAHVEDAAHNAAPTLTQAYSVSVVAPPAQSTGFLMGINIAGGEFGSLGGAYGSNYIYPSRGEIDYYDNKGLDVIRVPFLWERLQKSQFGALDATELSRLDDVVNYATQKGLKIVLDVHNYGSGFGNLIGTAGTPNSSFADFWGKVAAHYAGNSSVIFGLMNEPNQQSATTWLASANAAIDAIRKAGATNEILVPGSYWDGAWSWTTSDNAAVVGTGVKDPLKNFAFEVHQYLDFDGSGTHSAVVSEDVGVQRLTAVTQWAQQTGNKLFLGEFGVANDATSLKALDKMLAYMEQHTDAWQGGTYWAGGAWWGNYMYSAAPANGVDKAQLLILQQHANQVV